MSEKGSEADIQPRCVNVAEVPRTDISQAATKWGSVPATRDLGYRTEATEESST
jgi:hypothetical protein